MKSNRSLRLLLIFTLVLATAVLCSCSLIASLIGNATFTVTFDPNYEGAEPVVHKVSVTDIFSNVAEENAVTREGYTFDRWTFDVEGNNDIKFDDFKLSANITLYAQWIKNTYTIVFNPNYSGAESLSYSNVENPAELTLPNVQRDGYSFAYWAFDADGVSKVDFQQLVLTQDVTLYAHWTPVLSGKTITGISAVYDGNVVVGESLNLAKLTVKIHYSDGDVQSTTNFTLGEYDLSAVGTVSVPVTVTVDSVDYTARFDVTVVKSSSSTTIVKHGKYGELQEDGSVKITDTGVVDGELQIHFLELGNRYTGDCIYIKAGDTDVLIDAGSIQSSCTTISDYVDEFCTDGTLEYVIATHADKDHIAGFVGVDNKGIFDVYDCENIITFARTNKNTQIYQNFVNKKNAQAKNGANVYTALECYNNTNGASRVMQLSQNIEMEILYNYYYENSSSDENNYSVCLMINQYANDYDHTDPDSNANVGKVNHYLFTGDLEESGEEKLVQYNKLPQVVLFKAGHHGSSTSSNECLLSVIKPKVVCVCCCAGTSEYTQNLLNMFPTQAMVDRVSVYTDMVFVTTLGHLVKVGEKWSTSDVFESMNGNITIVSDKTGVFLSASNNVTLLKDTAWFKEYRTCPSSWTQSGAK